MGSEGGVVHMMKVMPWSLDIASSRIYDVGAPVLQMVQHAGWVWAGLADGRLVIFNISTGKWRLGVCCIILMTLVCHAHDLYVACTVPAVTKESAL